MQNVEGTLDIWIDPDNKCYMKNKYGTRAINYEYYLYLKEHIKYERYVKDLGLFQEYKSGKIKGFYQYLNADI